MITDIIKDRKPGDKPRFFLHDEMKQWLKDNLILSVDTMNIYSYDSTLIKMLNVHSITTGHNLSIRCSIDGEHIAAYTSQLHMQGYEETLKTLANVCTNCMQHINQLHAENQELKKRIELLENPIPV